MKEYGGSPRWKASLTPCCQLYVEKEKASTVQLHSVSLICVYIGGGCWLVCSLLAAKPLLLGSFLMKAVGRALGWGTLAFVVSSAFVAVRGL